MNANELMVGNIVGYSSLTRMVTAINPPYFIDLGNGERTTITNVCIEHLNPIPITDELLLKNGFTYSENRYCGRDLHIYTKKVYGQFMIECTEGFSGDGQYLSNVYELERREERAHTLGNVKHLHQLQNLCNIAGVEMGWKV